MSLRNRVDGPIPKAEVATYQPVAMYNSEIVWEPEAAARIHEAVRRSQSFQVTGKCGCGADGAKPATEHHDFGPHYEAAFVCPVCDRAFLLLSPEGMESRANRPFSAHELERLNNILLSGLVPVEDRQATEILVGTIGSARVAGDARRRETRQRSIEEERRLAVAERTRRQRRDEEELERQRRAEDARRRKKAHIEKERQARLRAEAYRAAHPIETAIKTGMERASGWLLKGILAIAALTIALAFIAALVSAASYLMLMLVFILAIAAGSAIGKLWERP